MVCAVGIDAPHSLGVTKIAVDVFPAVVDHSPVGQQSSVPFVQCAVADLLNVRSRRRSS